MSVTFAFEVRHLTQICSCRAALSRPVLAHGPRQVSSQLKATLATPEGLRGRSALYSGEVLESPVSKTPLIQRSPDILGGTPVFRGTRVPVQTLIDYLEAGDRLEEFLDDFPTVSREQAVAALQVAKEALIQDAGAA